ncbi:acetate kinase [Propionibacterium freudenreichii]|uniref:acetate/propionate family kinase n=1 Tax=Propionibacterium freudenreichii TaxID=1744 RepID=UPI00254D5FDE|nr:acetate kinase [Propionibacterium freudenreichii]MDK9646820.1 acetate kinase [Propionibacterium freudenreichii]MDK9666756.1 acetate kinase [Propionibacterium freudenreichii]
MAKPILVLNCGSSSIKYQLIDPDEETVLAKGLVERIGDAANGIVTHETDGQEWTITPQLHNHTVALQAVFKMFDDHGPGLKNVTAVAHRAVHGGDRFAAPVVIDDEVIATMQELVPLAPLHNPAVIEGIRAAQSLLGNVPHVAIFDTAFFTQLPEEAYTYAINRDLAKRNAIRKYGFHGTSHQYVSQQVPAVVGTDLGELNQIVCHLGNGASISAIKGGKPIDTSMGLTPLAGLVMGTRSGDIDPGVFAYAARSEGWSTERIDSELNKNSGMLGLTGDTDMRDVEAAFEKGDEAAVTGMNVYIHRLVFYIGGYAALLGRLDTLTFTAGVGENSSFVRKMVCDRLAGLGVVLDEAKNEARDKAPHLISAPESKVKVLVVRTNEELAMAKQTEHLLAS